MQPKKIFLSGGCWCSYPTVTPTNWKTTKASTQRYWRIHYRFYDPNIKDEAGKVRPRQVTVQSMNKYTDLKQRQAATKFLLEDILYMLQKEGYNPVLKEVATHATAVGILPDTPFAEALVQAYSKMEKADSTMRDIKSMLNYVVPAIKYFRMDILQINQVQPFHIVGLLDGMRKEHEVINKLGFQDKKNNVKPKGFSGHKYNKYRGYLQTLFKVLRRNGAIKSNPVNKEDVEKATHVKQPRQVLTREERKQIKAHLAVVNPIFGRFVEIFFHSGGRPIELIGLQVKDVDLINQTYRALVKKGGQYKYVERTIKTLSLPLWREQIGDAPGDWYVWSEGLVPGPEKIREDQISHRFRIWVKKKLGITADLYTLKHGNTSELVENLGDEAAAQQAGHTSTAMVVSIYDTQRRRREHERLKRANNAF